MEVSSLVINRAAASIKYPATLLTTVIPSINTATGYPPLVTRDQLSTLQLMIERGGWSLTPGEAGGPGTTQ